MKIKMLTLAAGPDGVMQPGKTYEVTEKEGKALVTGGYAVEAAAEKKERAVARKGETAAEVEK